MAIAFVAERADATSAAAGASLLVDMAAGASITVGNTLIMSIAARDSATPPTGGDGKIMVGDQYGADLRGNLWRRVAVSANAGSSTAADNGAVTAIWMCHVVYPYSNGDDITLYAPITSRPMTHVAVRIAEFSGVLRAGRILDSGAATGNSTAVSVTGADPLAAGQLVFATAAVASNPALTGDGDATNGAWTAIDQATSGASGITRGDQHKLVTAAGAQTWDITWAGAQQWAGVAIVLEEATLTWPFDNERLTNPNFPCPAGPEFLPVDRTTVAVDTGTGYIFGTTPPPESRGSSEIYWASIIDVPRDDIDTQHGVCCEVYLRGQEQERNEPFIFSLGVPYAVTASGGVIVDGGGTAVDALAAAGGSSLFIPGGDTVDLFFDASPLASVQDGYRILNARVEYVAWKDNSSDAAPGEGAAVFWRDMNAFRSSVAEGATRLHGAWLVNEYSPNARYVQKNLGEVNGYPRFGPGNGLMIDQLQACWTIRDFMHMNAGDQSTMLRIQALSGSFPSQQQIYLDTIRLELIIVKETRLAQSVRRVSSGVGFPNGSDTTGGIAYLPMFNATNTGLPWTAPSTAEELSVVVREPIPSSGSDWFSAQSDPTNIVAELGNYRYASMEQVGPSVVLYGIVQPRDTLDPVPSVDRAAWSVGQIAENAVAEPFGKLIDSVALVSPNSRQSWWPYYFVHNFLAEGASTSTTILQEVGVDGASSYDYLKVLIKPSFTTTDTLDFSIEQPTANVLAVATVSVADVLAQPDVGNGYREMLLPLSTTITPASTSAVEIYAMSATPDSAEWVIGSASSSDGRTVYHPQPLSTDPSVGTTWAMALCCPLEELEVSIETEEISTANDANTDCAAITSVIPCITVENAQEYDWISIERYVSGIDRTPVALIPGTLDESTELVAQDTFSRVVAGGWGTMDTGQTWVPGTPASFAVGSGRGSITDGSSATVRPAGFAVTDNDLESQVTFDVAATPTGAAIWGVLQVRASQESATVHNSYGVRVVFETDGTVSPVLIRQDGGTATTLATLPVIQDYVAGTGVTARIRVIGDQIWAMAWSGGSEPSTWQAGVVDATYATGGFARVSYARITGNTSPDPTLYVDDYLFSAFVEVPITWCDYGVPWDMPAGEISYVLHGFRNTDRRRTDPEQIIWNDTSPNPGAAFGLATDDALFVYVPVSDGGDLEVEWNPLNPIDSMPLQGQDYQVALRVPEDRGVEVTVNVIAKRLARCTVGGESS